MNMSSNVFEQWSAARKAGLEPMVELNGIVMRLVGELTQKNLNFLNECAHQGAEGFSHCCSPASPEEFLNGVHKCATHAAPQVFKHAHEVVDIISQANKEWNTWMEKQVTACGKQMKACKGMMNQAVQDVERCTKPQGL